MPDSRSWIHVTTAGAAAYANCACSVEPSIAPVLAAPPVMAFFTASYFAGALLIDREALVDDLTALFEQSTWSDQRLLDCMARYAATSEMFFYRLTELVPDVFGLNEIFFMRFHHEAGTDDFQLTKVLNMSEVAVPHGLGPREHYCRRWPAMHLLRELAARQARRSNGAPGNAPVVRAQRSHFIDNGAEFFVVSAARPLSPAEGTNSCVSLGFLMTDTFNDPKMVINMLSRTAIHLRG